MSVLLGMHKILSLQKMLEKYIKKDSYNFFRFRRKLKSEIINYKKKHRQIERNRERGDERKRKRGDREIKIWYLNY